MPASQGGGNGLLRAKRLVGGALRAPRVQLLRCSWGGGHAPHHSGSCPALSFRVSHPYVTYPAPPAPGSSATRHSAALHTCLPSKPTLQQGASYTRRRWASSGFPSVIAPSHCGSGSRQPPSSDYLSPVRWRGRPSGGGSRVFMAVASQGLTRASQHTCKAAEGTPVNSPRRPPAPLRQINAAFAEWTWGLTDGVSAWGHPAPRGRTPAGRPALPTPGALQRTPHPRPRLSLSWPQKSLSSSFEGP